MRGIRKVVVLACAVMGSVSAQVQPPTPNQPPPAPSLGLRPDYELGPNDQFVITVPEAAEINGRPFRIDSEGNIDLPLINQVHAAGLTVRGLETVITTRLRDYVREPRVSITVTQFRTEPVFFIGAFIRPGIYSLQGGRTLVEMLAVAGGLQPTAGRRIRVTRNAEYGVIDLPNAVKDPQRKTSYVEISLDSLTQNINPAEDLVLKAYDIVNVGTAQPVYVSGEVAKPGPVPLGEEPSISVTQALTLAGGVTLTASRGKVRVLRPILGTSRRAEINLDLNRIYAGKDNDFPLLPNDELYVPRASVRAILAPVGTSLLASMPYLIVTLAIGGVF
ncbi:MAG TPA: polysaccharide biosynthesis/export family protein [Blastocatellia bacterium]|nr:polysaccharide biosynthesis/export family protein [Blastocatellia bacterium]